MNFHRWNSIFGAVFIFIGLSTTFRAPRHLSNYNPWLQEGHLTIKSVERALTYFKNRPRSVGPDVILGVLFAKANLEWIIASLKLNFNNNFPLSKDLEKLIRQCDDLIELGEPESLPMLNRSFWKNAAGDLKIGALQTQDDQFVLPKFESCQSIDAYMMNGTPENSDFCINELFNPSCKISDGCWFSETNQDFFSGYKTTHRLLYFQTAAQLKCERMNPKFSDTAVMMNNLCRKILLEARALFRNPHFPLTRDLFMEQIALCGLQGYEEFAPKVWRKVVRSWQSRDGCFGHKEDLTCSFNSTWDKYERQIEKRSDTLVDECHTHVSAVAISAIAFYIRVILKTAFDLPSEGIKF